MNYIVLDMEWNQPFSKKKKRIEGGSFLKGEIIQLGAVKLDENFEVVSTFETNVKPVFYTLLNRHVKKITGLTSDKLRGKPYFDKAYEMFVDFIGDDCEFITWGCDDMPMLRDNMQAHGIETDSLPRCYNLQVIFNTQVSLESRQWSLADAMEKLGIEQVLEAHDALDDARNTAKICARLDMKKGIAEYSQNSSGIACPTVFTVRADGFKTALAAFSSDGMLETKCPFCEKDLSHKGFITKRSTKTAVAVCDEHGSFKYRVTVFRQGETYSIKKKVSLASDDMIKSYNEKKDLVKN